MDMIGKLFPQLEEGNLASKKIYHENHLRPPGINPVIEIARQSESSRQLSPDTALHLFPACIQKKRHSVPYSCSYRQDHRGADGISGEDIGYRRQEQTVGQVDVYKRQVIRGFFSIVARCDSISLRVSASSGADSLAVIER